eukprot:Skav230294  [mRNA]  locus=scaffold2934:139949:140700:- [translate_table: standard]
MPLHRTWVDTAIAADCDDLRRLRCPGLCGQNKELHQLCHGTAGASHSSEVKGCPSKAIFFVRQAEALSRAVPLLELAMRESVELAQNSGVLKARM